jgi:hypothetical protein
VTVRAVPLVTGEAGTQEAQARETRIQEDRIQEAGTGKETGWLPRAASAARSPWVAPWLAAGEPRETYLLDLVCARECAQADATGYDGAGYDGAGYAFTGALDPGLARREYVASGVPVPGLRLVSVSEPAKEHQR